MKAQLRVVVTLVISICVGKSFANGEGQTNITVASLQKASQLRPVTVADIIEMTQPGDSRFQGGLLSKHDIANFSPDGNSFVVLLRRGRVANDTNQYWIEYFRARDVLHGAGGVKLVQFCSSSNRPAISQVEWLDSHTLSFLAEQPGELEQLYSLDVNTRELKRLIASKVSLTAYAVSSRMHYIVFSTEDAGQLLSNERGKNSETVVRTQPLMDLLLGRDTFAHEFLNELYIKDGRLGRLAKLTPDGKLVGGSPLYLSPDGRHLIVETMVSRIAPEWNNYHNQALESQLHLERTPGERHLIYQFQIVDLASRKSRPLFNSPIPTGEYPDVVWAPDSKSVMLSGILLPLDRSNHVDETIRRCRRFLAELRIDNGLVTPIAMEDIRLRSWDATTGKVIGITGSWSGTGSLAEGRPIGYQKENGIWMKVATARKELEKVKRIDVTLAEDMNSSPKLFVEDRDTGKTRLLLDLNPQFRHLEFGEVRDLGVIKRKELSVNAGIYLPVGYKAGSRYPLVLQTHEWSAERFWIDGPFDSAFAAQALAGKGFIVAQIAMNRTHRSTLEEVRGEAQGYDVVIGYLDEHKMVDLSKIGIIGFSRTALGVKYALLHSKYHFAAATIADGSDVGYFRYVTYLNSTLGYSEDAEGINGGIPAGAGLQLWLRNEVDFNLSQISTPMRLEAYGSDLLFFAWEEFGILSRLNKPVDFIYLPAGEHVLVRVQDRLASQGGNVDWFSFWLQGVKDASPAKTQQYERWDKLKVRELAGCAHRAESKRAGTGDAPAGK
jgi:dipeptidyl aminopeptidase/acylaminoacyl peptidase